MTPSEQLWEAIQAKVKELGLVFADGGQVIDPADYRPSQPDFYDDNGKTFAGFSFSVTKVDA